MEDNPLDADLTSRELARHALNYHVDVASTLKEAHSHLVEDTPYDLILLDLRLPDGSGLDLLGDIRDRALPLATVVLTGSGDEEAAVAALKAGADDYLVKRGDYLTRLPLALETALNRFRAEAARTSRPLRVLYAEHNAADIDLTRRHLVRHAPHIHLEVVNTGHEVLQRFPTASPESRPCDVILLDYRLPRLDALELLKVLRQERGLDLPIVLVTGHGDEEIAIRAWRLGATDYLVKNTGYLFKLPVIVENAYHRVQLEREQNALRQSEERYRRLAENAPDVIYRYRVLPTFGFEYVSPACTAVIGYTPEEYYADPELGFKHIHPDDRSALEQSATEEALHRPVVLRWIRKDGAIIWIEQHNVPVYDDQGNLIALEGIARDITERRRAQMAEREQRVFAEALADTAKALISALNLDSVMNTILENVAHVVPHEAANIMLIEGDQARPIYWRGYRPERTQFLQEFRVSITQTPDLRQMHKTGKPFLASHTDQYPGWVSQPATEWVKSYVAAPIRSHDNVIGFLNLDSGLPGFFTEDHARRLQTFADQASVAIEHAQLYERIHHHAAELERRVEERTAELQQSEARYRAIIEDQTDMVCRYLPGGILTYVNRAYCKLFRREPEELLGTSLLTLLPDEERSRLEQLIASLNRQHPVDTIELSETTSDGHVRWFHWINRMIFDEAGNFVEYQAVGRDITQRKRAEEQLRQMLAHEMELSELKSRYVSMAAHDLRNPLAVIQTAIDIVRHYGDRLTEEQKQTRYAHIQTNIKVMLDMLNDILTIGQVESGKLTFDPAPLDVVAFCQSVSTETSQTAGAATHIVFDSRGDCSTAHLDAKLLRHILGNLLSNAIKYSSENQPVTFMMDCEPNQITFHIQDRGIGIPKEEQSRLFEAFHRASNTVQIPGTGLGLAIVQQSVELHGGTITFESEEGCGTTFTVIIPQTPLEKAREEDAGL